MASDAGAPTIETDAADAERVSGARVDADKFVVASGGAAESATPPATGAADRRAAASAGSGRAFTQHLCYSRVAFARRAQARKPGGGRNSPTAHPTCAGGATGGPRSGWKHAGQRPARHAKRPPAATIAPSGAQV